MGIRDLTTVQDAYSYKVWHLYHYTDSLWGCYMRVRYGSRNDFRLRLYDSHGWKRFCAIHSLYSTITSFSSVPIWPTPSGAFALRATYVAIRPSRFIARDFCDGHDHRLINFSLIRTPRLVRLKQAEELSFATLLVHLYMGYLSHYIWICLYGLKLKQHYLPSYTIFRVMGMLFLRLIVQNYSLFLLQPLSCLPLIYSDCVIYCFLCLFHLYICLEKQMCLLIY